MLFLDSGTTVRAIIPYLQDRRKLTIASNSITDDRRASIGHLPDSAIFCTGGMLSPTAQTFVGPVAERFFGDFFARKAIVSGIGFTIQTGLADSQMLDTAVKKAMSAFSRSHHRCHRFEQGRLYCDGAGAAVARFADAGNR